jgi:perosamine synthetase
MRAALREAGVDSRPVFPAISQYPMWTQRQEPGAVAHRIGLEGVNLPSGVKLRRDQVARVGAAVRDTMRSAAGSGISAPERQRSAA